MFDKVVLQTAEQNSNVICESQNSKTIEFSSATFTMGFHPTHGRIITVSTPHESFLITCG